MSGGQYPPGSSMILMPIGEAFGPGPEDEEPLYGSPRYPGHGYLPRPGENRPALSAFGRLSRGGAFGKKVNIIYQSGGSEKQRGPVPILQLEGDDADAQQLTVTLSPPAVIPQAFSATLAHINGQNLTGEQDNFQIQNRGVFPGLIEPIQWPPIEAIIEWGVGGTNNRAAVDFLNGATVNIVASWVRVSVAIVSGADVDVTGTSAAYTLGAFVGPGFPRPGVAQKTVYIGQIDSLAESEAFSVPKFAKRATVVGCDPAGTPAVTVATLRFWQSPDATNCVGNFIISGNQPVPFDIPNGAAYATVINGMGVASRMSILYNLAI